MRLGALIDSDDETIVTGFAIDHRKVAPGTVFGAFRGARFNGEDFIGEAVASGAIAVVARPGAPVTSARLSLAATSPGWRRGSSRLSRAPSSPSPGPTARPRRWS
jgi:UDP-N-acetylmuramoyl-L-alanyl-D-glutamate--2,6-diaminopimelate ligase